jgi:hypothetical protein
VVVAGADGVKVGLGVALGVLLGVAEKVAVAGGPSWIDREIRPKPGVAAGVGDPLLLPPQLSIPPKASNTTGATTSNLSHRDNIKG